ncbi:SDR family oxidoreductase [Thalassotalea sp. LPB0316]|uniref:SDR family oxidoreductase n=1 Tax=Thalassotalea sp. LPB0316 TaxID=2769490 RepID=UPI00186756DC|nr:SDR family oxidoreductase [Thalassotalea sp. LPB0316]QOL26047.1 SDR family oxidoreductase [Thalassotalea sp. LPB0316]
MSQITFNDRVVIVTGAGNGLGKAYALEFAKRGAKVVVNDLGGSFDGEGSSSAAADIVVNEIKAAGGEAVANYDSVEYGDKIVKTAIDSFGRVDIVINNAGFLRDSSFSKLTDDNWQAIQNVHVNGAYSVTKAAWPYMVEQNFGRVIFTTSAAGIYGNFGQANYSAAKSALLGLGKTLALEGARKNIHVNVIAPIAGSRLTETIWPDEVLRATSPDYVVPLVIKLSSDDNSETGGVFEVGASWFAKIRIERTRGYAFGVEHNISAEDVASKWEQICDFTDAQPAESIISTFHAVGDMVGLDLLNAKK